MMKLLFFLLFRSQNVGNNNDDDEDDEDGAGSPRPAIAFSMVGRFWSVGSSCCAFIFIYETMDEQMRHKRQPKKEEDKKTNKPILPCMEAAAEL